ELDRRAGEKDRRWVHLLGPVVADADAAAVDRESVLGQGAAVRDAKVVAAYDTIADAYAADPSSEVRHPFETWLLDEVPGLAEGFPIADLGCGPGHVTARLAEAGAELGVSVVGFDPSPAMVAAARAEHPEVEVQQASLAQFLRPRTAEAWGVVVAWYSLIHLAASELPEAFAALARTVRVGGWVLVALHAGQGIVHADEWLGHEVDLDIVLHDRPQVVAAAEAAGLTVMESYTRGALRPPHGSERFDRLYVLARRDG
ncbi:MAG: class I SAM-dependent methyltransferase, partial [Propionibacteriaceae bacterium]|nr:class I SAM-dependent methyltransferase [Propionibacteriaceae bacterium]